MSKKAHQVTQSEELDRTVQQGTADQLRRLFDADFWRGERPAIGWKHVLAALLRDDGDMLRLLIIWGARGNDKDLAVLQAEHSDKYMTYIRTLRLAGLPVSTAPEKPRMLNVGEHVAGQGVYLGVYTPKDRAGKSLGKVFNVFAAPQDLPETMKYVDAVKHIAKLKDWNGFDGTNYATDKEIYAALKDGSYNGGWIIPTRDILHGKDVDGKDTAPDNILAHKDKGSLKGTFKMTASKGSDCPGWYWSSTERRDDPSGVWYVRFSDGNGGWDLKDLFRLSCRPVRLVKIAP